MKKPIISLILTIFAISVSAAPVSLQTARSIVSNILKGKNIETPARKKGVKGMDEEVQPYYVFNADNQTGGYVIVAGDDRLPAVLGYSLEGNLDMDNAPEAMIALLDMSVANAEKFNVGNEGNIGTPVVSPLLGDINWGQDSPFNTLCPTLSGGSKSYVGCVATAMAQIMRYYSYPDKGIGSHSYIDGSNSLSADFGNTTYDWANMPSVVPSNPTDAQTTAYSTLSSHLGIAVDMQYATGGSGAYTHMVAPALRNYFGYSPELRMHTREYYNSEEWMQMIRKELDSKRPVYYSASSEDGAGGHAFVCDGYDSEGYVHINWGWYGRSNGYFYINHLNPGDLGEGGGSGAYNIAQEILTGFHPANVGEVPNILLFGASRLSCDYFGDSMLVMSYVENLDTDSFEGTLSVVLTDTDEKAVLAELQSNPLSLAGFKNGRTGAEMVTFRNVTTSANLPDGYYHLKLAYKSKGEESYKILRHPMGLPGYMVCNVKDKVISSVNKHQPVPDVVMETPLSSDGEIYANGSARFSVSLRNNAKDFKLSSLVLTLKNVEKPDLKVSQKYPVNIYDLSSQNVIMDIDMPENLTPGEYEVSLSHEKYEEFPFATKDGEPVKVKLLPAAETPVLRFVTVPQAYNATDATSELKRGELLYANLSVKNYGAEGDCMVLLRAVNKLNPDKSTVIKAESRKWKKGDNVSIKMSNSLALDPGSYECRFYYLPSSGIEVPMAADPIEVEVLECDSPVIEVIGFTLPEQMKQGESYQYSVEVKALRNVVGTFYVRARQYTYTNGELVYMGSINMKAGETKTFSGKYKPSTTLANGKYLTMVEIKEGSTTAPASGHSVYYKEIGIGEDTSGVSSPVVGDESAPVEWFTIEGHSISMPTIPGIYIRRQGSVSKKFIVR